MGQQDASQLPTTRHDRKGRSGATPLLTGAAVLAALAGAALFNQARARRAERETPPAGRFVEVDGVRLHYVTRGDGRPVVLLHGNGMMVQDMEASGLLDDLAQRYRVVAFDRPGFGYSERPRDRIWTPQAQAELIHAALGRLGIERPILVGHSWGTLVALALALEQPQDVGALVLLGGYYYPTARADVLTSGPAVPVVGDLMRLTVSPLLGRLMAPAVIRRVFAPAPVAESFSHVPLELALRPAQIRATAADTALMIPGAAQLSRRYGELSLPVVIVAGAGDRIVDVERQAVRLHEALPGSALRLIDGVGHMVHHSAPDEVMAAIEAAAARAAGLPTGDMEAASPRQPPTA